MLGVSGARLGDAEDGVDPPSGAAGVRVVSMELLQRDEDTPLRWRGPSADGFVWRGTAEASALREFLADVVWGELDYLLIDLPPGTDKIERLLDLVRPHQTLLVTTPAELSRFIVAKSARLLREAGLESIGLVANMTAFVAPDGTTHALYEADAARALAAETGLPLWAEIPFEPRLAACTDAGQPFVLAEPGAPAARAFARLAEQVERGTGGRNA
jgi:ATP-binding protein involved in chromosome partitioning